jgi:short-subunit dehydrogenase
MNIIVTGASKGIGFETVKILASNPQNRLFAISRNQAGLEKLKQECDLVKDSGKLDFLAFDLVNGNFEKNLLPAVLNRMNSVDVLVNNAGLLISKPFRSMEDIDFNRIFDVNVKSVFRLIKLLLPYFSSNSHIINIASMGGFQGSVKFPGLSLYSASKGAVAILSECLAEELKEQNIKVNCLALGSAQTEMLAEAFPGYQSPLSSSEMAQFIADFSMNGHRWFNGKVLPVAITTP